jgi:hypothetical protein
MFPLNDNGMISGLLCGVLFGYVLENAGFGSPAKLSAQFRLTDWAVLKVMFTAIVVAAFGLWLMRLGGLLKPDSIAVPQAAMAGAAVGGALVGAGFAVGGYCPGTSVAGLFSGRLDALVFIVGVVLGTIGFAVFYGAALKSLKAAWLIAEGDTFTDAYAFGSGNAGLARDCPGRRIPFRLMVRAPRYRYGERTASRGGAR